MAYMGGDADLPWRESARGGRRTFGSSSMARPNYADEDELQATLDANRARQAATVRPVDQGRVEIRDAQVRWFGVERSLREASSASAELRAGRRPDPYGLPAPGPRLRLHPCVPEDGSGLYAWGVRRGVRTGRLRRGVAGRAAGGVL